MEDHGIGDNKADYIKAFPSLFLLCFHKEEECFPLCFLKESVSDFRKIKLFSWKTWGLNLILKQQVKNHSGAGFNVGSGECIIETVC